MDPVSAIADAIGAIANVFSTKTAAKYGRLPKWLSPADYQRRNETTNALLIGVGAIILVIIVAIVIVARKSK
jgi:hypothetical protein